MKAYLFNTDKGLYAGETFEEAGMLQYVDGITPIAAPRYESDRFRSSTLSTMDGRSCRFQLSVHNYLRRGANSMKSTLFGLIVITLCTIFGAVSPRASAAVSYVPHNLIEQPATDTTIYKHPGAIVYLFHGTTAEIIQPLIGQVFSVFRESAAGSPAGMFKVGTIRLSKSSGDNHVEAVVVEGELKGGDIAHLGAINGLVVLTKERCETLKQTDHEPRK